MKKILNVLLGLLMAVTVVLLIYAIATAGSEAAISLNLIWGYFLFVFALAAALFCALFGMIKNPAGIKGTIMSLALVLIVIGASYFFSAGHDVQIVDLQNNGFFGHNETVITETSILVTYVAFAAAFVIAVATEIWGTLKNLSK